jgi:hypothetical protein
VIFVANFSEVATIQSVLSQKRQKSKQNAARSGRILFDAQLLLVLLGVAFIDIFSNAPIS